jgi:hypothetical protein
LSPATVICCRVIKKDEIASMTVTKQVSQCTASPEFVYPSSRSQSAEALAAMDQDFGRAGLPVPRFLLGRKV